MMRLDNKFVPVDPRNWNTGWDMTVTVGLGTGDKEQELMHLQVVGTYMEKMLAAGKAHMITDKNLYSYGRKLVESTGYKHVEEFITNPEGQQPPPPPPSPEVIKAQSEKEITQMKLQADQQKSIGQASVEKLMKDIEVQGQIQIARINVEAQMAIKTMELNAASLMKDKELRTEAEFEVFRANNEASIKQAEIDAERERELLKAQVSENASIRQSETQKEAAKEASKQKQIESKQNESRKNGESREKSPPINVTVPVTIAGGKRVTTVKRDKDGNMTGAESVDQ
jgi:hypothetical protein